MSYQGENDWSESVLIVTCPRCSASAEAPAPIAHKDGCVLRMKWEMEATAAAERAGGWTGDPS